MQKWYYDGILDALEPIKNFAMYSEFKWLLQELF